MLYKIEQVQPRHPVAFQATLEMSVLIIQSFKYGKQVRTVHSSAAASIRAMSFSGASEEGSQVTKVNASGPSTPNSPGSIVQTAWKSVRSNFKVKKSTPDLKRWWSYPRASESNSQREERHPEDAERSLFCESLLGLMQRTGRFDYLDYDKDTTESEKEREKQGRSLKRFSWSR